jgi:predicted O-methyltransferase YrrM
VDVEGFLETLPALWDDFPTSEQPRDPRFAEVLEQVRGLARPNNLALLNHAARYLEPGEAYAEAGTFRGTSLIAALLDNEEREFVAIDDFSLADAKRSELDENLHRLGLAERPTILEGDVFELLRDGALDGRRVGVWYYDAGHGYEQQLNGLRLVEPYLASRAVLIVDDADWERVRAATRDYLAAQPRARVLLDLPGQDRGSPHWWYGVQVLGWEMVGAASGASG